MRIQLRDVTANLRDELVAFFSGFLTAVIPRMIIPSTCLFYVRWGLIVNKPFRFVLLDGNFPSRVPLWGSVGFFSKPLQLINSRLQGRIFSSS